MSAQPEPRGRKLFVDDLADASVEAVGAVLGLTSTRVAQLVREKVIPAPARGGHYDRRKRTARHLVAR